MTTETKTTCIQCHKIKNIKRWIPKPVAHYDILVGNLICAPNGIKHATNIRKNLCYNLQYLEFNEQLLHTHNLTSVLTGQTYKSSIVFGGSIAEAVLFAVIIKHNYRATREYQEVEKFYSNESKSKSYKSKIRIITIIEEKLDGPENIQMTFDQMIKITTSRKLLGKSFDYAQLVKMRKLRNKIHIHAIDEAFFASDTDYWNFTNADYVNFKKILKELLIQALKPSLGEADLLDWL